MRVSHLARNPFYTICLDIVDKPVLVAGGGEVARRKVSTLCDSGARVTVVSPKVDPVLEYMAFQKEIIWKERSFERSDLDYIFIAIAATDDRETNHRISEMCKKNGILCNIVDASEESSFIVPSTIERGPLTIAISTSGISPTLAASIRQELEMAYGEEYGKFLELMSALRPMVQESFPSPLVRQRIFDRMIASRALTLLRNGMEEQAQKELKEIIYDAQNDPQLKELSASLPVINSNG